MATFSRLAGALALLAALVATATSIAQQAQAPPALGAPAQGAVGTGVGVAPTGTATTAGSAGGAASADFDSLIDLITSTVETESWAENGTGEGEIQSFPNGVYLDVSGALCVASTSKSGGLAALRKKGAASARAKSPAKSADESDDTRGLPAVTMASKLRYVSLPRLEAEIAARQAAHQPLSAEILALAGLQRITHVFVYPETHDVVIAGPAGDWQAATNGRLLSMATQRPIVRLDDLLTLMRRAKTERGAAFGCSIVPRQESLARTQEYVSTTADGAIDSRHRRAWLEGLRESVGVQDVEYYNIDPDTRIARLLLEADYHMKLVGMGLAPGVPGVKSYLATVRLDASGNPPPMTVLRWWFSMPEAQVATTPAHDAFELPASCVEVLSENELLAARGEQVHLGMSEDLNRQFAESFTAAFEQLAIKYPVYDELARVFEVALALAVIEREGLAEKAGWAPGLLVDGERLRLPSSKSPRSVETVINHRVIGGRHIVAGVSGGVWVDGGKRLAVAPGDGEKSSALASRRGAEAPPAEGLYKDPGVHWWWD